MNGAPRIVAPLAWEVMVSSIKIYREMMKRIYKFQLARLPKCCKLSSRFKFKVITKNLRQHA